MEAYYVQVNLDAAQVLSDGLALEKVNASRDLTKDVQIGEAKTKRKVDFHLDKSKEAGDEAEYIYSVSIDSMGMKSAQTTRLRLRKKDGDWKVTQYSDIPGESRPTKE